MKQYKIVVLFVFYRGSWCNAKKDSWTERPKVKLLPISFLMEKKTWSFTPILSITIVRLYPTQKGYIMKMMTML